MAKKTEKTVENGTAKGNAAVKRFKARGVHVSIFENMGDDGRKWYKASLQRIYKEGDEFKTTNSLSRDDLPVAQHLLNQAWDWILVKESESKNDSDE